MEKDKYDGWFWSSHTKKFYRWNEFIKIEKNMTLKKSQRSLRQWTKQKWRTKSGKKSSETGERYLPEKAIKKSLSAAEYAATSRKKRKTLR